VISKECVHKFLEINLLQNSLYGRLAVDGTLALERPPRERKQTLAMARHLLSRSGFRRTWVRVGEKGRRDRFLLLVERPDNRPLEEQSARPLGKLPLLFQSGKTPTLAEGQ